MIDSMQDLGNLLSEKDEGFTRRKIKNFCSLLNDSRQCEEVSLFIKDYFSFYLEFFRIF